MTATRTGCHAKILLASRGPSTHEEWQKAESGNGLVVADKHRGLPVKAVPRSEILQNTIGVAAGEAG
jgi:hypothetical protein